MEHTSRIPRWARMLRNKFKIRQRSGYYPPLESSQQKLLDSDCKLWEVKRSKKNKIKMIRSSQKRRRQRKVRKRKSRNNKKQKMMDLVNPSRTK